MKIAKERKSSVLASNAIHHRIDSLTSIVALVAIGGSHVFTGTTWLDPVGGLIVSMMVIKAGWGNTCSALLELADVGVDEDTRFSVRDAATKALSQDTLATSGKTGALAYVRDVQGVKAGQNYLMDVDLVIPNDWTIQEARRIEDVVRKAIGSNVRGVRRVKVRFVPKANDAPGFSAEFIGPDLKDQRTAEPLDGKDGHDDHGNEHDHNGKRDQSHHHHAADRLNNDLRKRI